VILPPDERRLRISVLSCRAWVPLALANVMIASVPLAGRLEAVILWWLHAGLSGTPAEDAARFPSLVSRGCMLKFKHACVGVLPLLSILQILCIDRP
jgi:hypothetical protein